MTAPRPETELTGTAGQIGWAELIRPIVDAEFHRVSKAFQAVATNQDATARIDTEAILAILEEKRAETLSNSHAGYFIRDWGELGDQVRQLLAADVRYRAIKANRDSRNRLREESV